MVSFCEGHPNCFKCGKPLRKGFSRNCGKVNRLPLGTWLSLSLQRVGVEKKEGCGCGARQVKYDKFGARVYFTCVGLWNGLKAKLPKFRKQKNLATPGKPFHGLTEAEKKAKKDAHRLALTQKR